MAIIGKIRERSTLVLIVIGGAIIAFVLTDLFSSGGNSQQGPINIAEVNGVTVSPSEFDDKVQKAYENYAAQTQQELDESIKSSIREEVWKELMSDLLIGRQMEKLGIEVTSKELFDMVQGDNPHPQVRQVFTNPETGEFNSGAVVQFLQNLDNDENTKKQWVAFEKALKRNRHIEKYYVLVKKGLYTPAELAKVQHAENTSMAIKYIYKSYGTIDDSTVTVEESDIKKYYEENKADYEQKASRKIAYAYFPVVPSDYDKQTTKEWVDETYIKFQNAENDSTFVNANSDNRFNPIFYSEEFAPVGVDTTLWDQEDGFVTEPILVGNIYSMYKVRASKMAPDSVKASHILLSFQNNTPERAEELTDSLMQLLEGGTPFADLVSFSNDPSAAENAGDLGWVAEGAMVKPLSDAAFSAEIGDYTKVESQFGFHILEVTDRTEIVKKLQVAIIEREILPGKETYADLFNEATSFSINVTDMESFRNEITAKNIQQRSAVLTENDNIIQGLTASRDATRWAKEAKEGDVSEAHDVDDAFIVAIVENVDVEGTAPLDKVRNRVEFLARQEKKAEIIINELGTASSIGEMAASSGLSVENANINFSSPTIPSVGFEPDVIGVATALNEGEMSQPIQGNNGVFVITIDKKEGSGDANIAQIRDSQSRGWISQIDNGAVFNALKENSDLVDNRSKFY